MDCTHCQRNDHGLDDHYADDHIVFMLDLIYRQGEKNMTTIQEALAEVQAEGNEVALLVTAFQEQTAQIAALQVQISALQPGQLTPEQQASVDAIFQQSALTLTTVTGILPAQPPTSTPSDTPVVTNPIVEPFVVKTQEDVDTPDAEGAEPGSGAYEHYRERLFIYNEGKPVEQQASSDITIEEWTALPIG